ncbi:MAG: DUF4112 domain-containing protein [Cyanobacteria bacterium J06635_15]
MPQSQLTPILKRLRAISTVMDNAVAIPGTGFKFGLDPIVGLLPGGGDLLSGVLSIYIVFEAMRLGLPTATLLRMTWNIVLEVIIGTVPILGDGFDLVWKANAKNVQLVEHHVRSPQTNQRANRWFALVLIVGLLGLVGAIALGSFWLATAIFRMLVQH